MLELDVTVPFMATASGYVMMAFSFHEHAHSSLFIWGFVLYLYSCLCRIVGTHRYLAGRYEEDDSKNTVTNMFCTFATFPCHSLPYICFTLVKSALAPVDWITMLGYHSSSGIWRLPVSTLGFPFKKEIEIMERKFFRDQPIPRQFLIGLGSGLSGTRGIVKIIYHAPFDDFDHVVEYSSEEFKREIALIALMEEILQNFGSLMMSIASISSPASIVCVVFSIISILYETGYLIGKRTKEGIRISRERQQPNV